MAAPRRSALPLFSSLVASIEFRLDLDLACRDGEIRHQQLDRACDGWERVEIAHLALVPLPDQSPEPFLSFADRPSRDQLSRPKQNESARGLRIPARRADVVAVAVELDVSGEPYPSGRSDSREQRPPHPAAAPRAGAFSRGARASRATRSACGRRRQAHLAWHFELGVNVLCTSSAHPPALVSHLGFNAAAPRGTIGHLGHGADVARGSSNDNFHGPGSAP